MQVLSVLIFAGMFAGCETLGLVSGPTTLANDILAGPERAAAEKQGAAVFDRTMFEKNAVVLDPAPNEYVRKITDRIVQVSHRKNSKFTVRVLNDKSVNAFSIGGEYLYVNTGLLQFFQNNQDGVAGVLGHEIAHDIAGHSARNMTAQKWQLLATRLVDSVTGNQVAHALAGTAGDLLLLKYSRNQEKEADILGTLYAGRAGYDVKAFMDFFYRMREYSSVPDKFAFMTDHPSYEDRIRTLALVDKYLKRQITIGEIAAVDPKVAEDLDVAERLDTMGRQREIE